jgi:hypothetical protein
MTTSRFVLGVDVDQAHEYTVLVVIERVAEELHARHIERLPLDTPYPKQTGQARDRTRDLPRASR